MTLAELNKAMTTVELAVTATTTTTGKGKAKKETTTLTYTPESFRADLDNIGELAKAIGTTKGSVYQAAVMAGIGGVPAKGSQWQPQYFTLYTQLCEGLWKAEGLEGLEKGQMVKKANTHAQGLKRAWYKVNGLELPKAQETEAQKILRKLFKAAKEGKMNSLTILNDLKKIEDAVKK